MSPLWPPIAPSSSVRLEEDAKDAADPVTPDVPATLVLMASQVLPALQVPQGNQADLQSSARRLIFHHATRAHRARQVHPDPPDHPETAAHPARLASQEPTVNPVLKVHPARTDHPDLPAQMAIAVMPVSLLRALQTRPVTRVPMESPARLVLLATTALLDETASLDNQDPTALLDPPAHPERTAKMAQLAPLVNPDRKASAVSAPNTAHWTAVYSSKTEHDESRDGPLNNGPCCMQSTNLPFVASFIDIFRIAVIFRCHQSVKR